MLKIDEERLILKLNKFLSVLKNENITLYDKYSLQIDIAEYISSVDILWKEYNLQLEQAQKEINNYSKFFEMAGKCIFTSGITIYSYISKPIGLLMQNQKFDFLNSYMLTDVIFTLKEIGIINNEFRIDSFDDIWFAYEIVIKQSVLLSEVEDNRARRNLAVAISSLKLLIKLVDEPNVINFESYKERLKKYISEVVEIKNDNTDRFIIILKELLDERRGKLQAEVDYKLFSDGIHLSTGKYGRTLEIHFKKLFEAHFRGVKPLAMKDYEKKLKAIGAVAKNSHYSANIGSRYGLFLPFEVFTELKYLADRLEYVRIDKINNEQLPTDSICPF